MAAGTAGIEVSSWKLRVALQADWFPARSRARACQWNVPSGSAAGIHEALPPLERDADVLDWTTGEQEVPAAAEAEQSWNCTVPLLPADGASSNEAFSCGSAFVKEASAGLTRFGVEGATLSTAYENEAGLEST